MAVPIFTLSSGRSGTSYLANFFKHHVYHCISSHEPYLTPYNATLFGKPIAWNARQQDDLLLPLLHRKQQFIQRCSTPFYFEANHALVKSAHRHLLTLFPSAVFIHLLRSAKTVAKSELLREQVIRRLHLPFIEYTQAQGQKRFLWSLCGEEDIYNAFAQAQPQFVLSRYGFYVLQWFEIEWRIQQILSATQQPWFSIDVAQDLRNETCLKQLLDQLKLSYKIPLKLDLARNKTWFVGSSTLSAAEEAEYAFIVNHLPKPYADLVQLPPYNNCSFSRDLA